MHVVRWLRAELLTSISGVQHRSNISSIERGGVCINTGLALHSATQQGVHARTESSDNSLTIRHP